MSAKIRWADPTEKVVPTFGNLRTEQYFIYDDELYVKIDEVYMACEINDEIDCCHSLEESDDIYADKYNCYCINDGAFFSLENDTPIIPVNIEIVVSPKN